MFVKVCGTTNLPDAELAVELGADALGFIFAPSKRRVTVEQAAEIARFLPEHVGLIGVFAEPDVAEIARTVDAAGVNAVQMHWTYDRAMVGAIRSAVGEKIKLWQVVGYPVQSEFSPAAESAFVRELRGALLDERLAMVVLDSVKDGQSGGQGVPFSWGSAYQSVSLARAAARDVGANEVHQRTPHLVLAGGLSAANVGEAIQAMRPWGVDVVSGVEISPGRKDPGRLKAFMNEATRARGEESWGGTPPHRRINWNASSLPKPDPED